MHRTLFACFSLVAVIQAGITAADCRAQLSVNADWRDRTGLSVADSQVVKVKATKLRLFATLSASGNTAEESASTLKESKKQAAEVLKENGGEEPSLQFSAVRFINAALNGETILSGFAAPLIPITGRDDSLGEVSLVCDFPLNNLDVDAQAVLPHKLTAELRKEDLFRTAPISLLFVGRIDEAAVSAANRRAYEAAFDRARSLISLTGKTLGKPAAISATVNHPYSVVSGKGYVVNHSKSGLDRAIMAFSPAADEVYRSEPDSLSRTYTIDLRFEIP